MSDLLDILPGTPSKPIKPVPKPTRPTGPSPCSCCEYELPHMYEGTDGTVYCRTCSMRGGVMYRGCPMCNDKPAIETRLFVVRLPNNDSE